MRKTLIALFVSSFNKNKIENETFIYDIKVVIDRIELLKQRREINLFW